MRDFSPLDQLPRSAGLYALLGVDTGSKPYVAYVGMTGGKGGLRDRVAQHLIRRDSSATTSVGAVQLHPDYVVGCAWWVHSRFENSTDLRAAEAIAHEQLAPRMGNRGGIGSALADAQVEFVAELRKMLTLDGATGKVDFPGVTELAAELRELRKLLEAP